jgi:peptidoglycan/LPS O-acetylase OafA/YrhL
MYSRSTFGTILQANNGVGRGFDLLRLALALTIVASHCSSMSGSRGFLSAILLDLLHLIWPVGGDITLQHLGNAAVGVRDNNSEAIIGLGRPFTLSHVPMFFALSGFLVMGSAFRTRRVLPFLTLRVFRIIPALFVEVTLSAVVLGAVFTSLPLREYYSSAGFWAYFGNILGFVHFFLPGVSFNGSIMVNANLWTLPAEFYSYLFAAIAIATGLLFNKNVLALIFVTSTAALLIANSLFGYQDTLTVLPGSVQVYYFFVGAMFYIWRDRIPYSVWLFVPAVLLTYFLMFSTRTVYVYPILLTYITVFIGLTALPTNRLIKSGDYSYGIYLYGFPISQTLVSSVPALQHNLFGLLLSSVLCTGLFACVSWHLVEKRFLRLRKYFSPQSAKLAEELHPMLRTEEQTGAEYPSYPNKSSSRIKEVDSGDPVV